MDFRSYKNVATFTLNNEVSERPSMNQDKSVHVIIYKNHDFSEIFEFHLDRRDTLRYTSTTTIKLRTSQFTTCFYSYSDAKINTK